MFVMEYPHFSTKSYKKCWSQDPLHYSNTDKSHLLLSGKNNLTANIDGNVIESQDNQVLLAITIDSNLSCNKHINNLCKKAKCSC